MRVSSDSERQSTDLQRDALLSAGVDARHLFADHASGAKDDRPGLTKALDFVQAGDVLVVWKLDRLGRSLSHLLIYWHVERKSLCIHSQLKSPSSSEVASMIEGVLHHCTEMEVDRQYVDSHGQSTVAFAFCRLLGFELLPRLKAIQSQKGKAYTSRLCGADAADL